MDIFSIYVRQTGQFFWFSVLLLLTSCSSTGSSGSGWWNSGPKAALPEWSGVVISADADANQNSPVAIDIVLVRDPAVVETLLAMSSAKWFATRQDLIRTFSEDIKVIGYEVVPKQTLRLNTKNFANFKAISAIVFADYPTPGDHRERLSLNVPGYAFLLGEKEFKVSSLSALAQP